MELLLWWWFINIVFLSENRMCCCGFRRNQKWSWQFLGYQKGQIVSEIRRPLDQETAQVGHNWHVKSEWQQRTGPQFEEVGY